MKLVENILTKNDCYKSGRKITVKGLMLHSVGCAQPSAAVFLKNWNRPGLEVCVHGFVDGNTGTVYQALPWDHRGWHAGGAANNTHIGVEMCEPACIKYTSGANFTCSNVTDAKAVAKRTYEAAVELFAYLCKKYGLDPLKDGVIISHREGCARGVASNHGDPEHLWKQLGMGYTMDGFRKAVSTVLKGGSVTTIPKPETPPTGNGGGAGVVLKVGSEVDFTGNRHYTSSYGSAVAKICKPGKATITAIAPGSAHPYHCVAIRGKGATVHGWVDAGDVSAVSVKPIVKGGKVKVLKAVTYTGKPFKTYYDTYDVLQVNEDRVVIGIGKTVTAAVSKTNLQAV